MIESHYCKIENQTVIPESHYHTSQSQIVILESHCHMSQSPIDCKRELQWKEHK
jgi:hypothetical protein